MTEIIPNDIYREYVTRGEDWADKRGAADLLEGALKSLKAQLFLDAKGAASCSVATAESTALASTEYRCAMENAVEARKEANKAHVRYVATQALFEARRTAEASQRAAMRSGT